MAIKFYKDGNQFVLGEHSYDYKPSGEYEADVHYVGNVPYLAIIPLGTSDATYREWDHPYSDYVDNTDTPYASIEALMLATKGFFTAPVQSTSIVDSSGNPVTLSSGEPRTLFCEYTRPANTTIRPANGAINETVSVIKELLSTDAKQSANLNGGGGIIVNGSLTSNNTSDVGRQFGIIFLREDISPIIADNSVQTLLYSDYSKRVWTVYTTLEAQPAGSDCVIGRFSLPFEYTCKSDSKALKALIFDVTGGTTVSGSKYTISVNTQVSK